MGKYIKWFETHEEYEEFIQTDDFILPNVSCCGDEENVVHYNPWVRDYSKEYLTFEIVEDGTITIKASNANIAKTISYSTDEGNTWTDLTTSTTEQSLGSFSAGDTIMLKGTNTAYGTSSYNNQFGGTAKYNAYGNIMSLLYGDDFDGQTTFPTGSTYTFKSLFYQSTGLVEASNLVLPATTLKTYCYQNMFQNCTSLTQAPNLPATTLAKNCYQRMFASCTSLDTVPELPATTLNLECYAGMFQNCTSLTTVPELPATTLTGRCYQYMFYGCTSLTQAPNLIATTLAENCYGSMFRGCTSLTIAPSILPATTLVSNCYENMFYGCTSLVSAPELSATTLANYCYSNMFNGCTSLTSAPELPATTLAVSCYSNMFWGCTSLTSAPELPATTLANYCYLNMFNGCTNLNYIKAMFTTTPDTSYTSNWVKGVASTGTFVKSSAATWDVTGVNGIPTGWTVETASA